MFYFHRRFNNFRCHLLAPPFIESSSVLVITESVVFVFSRMCISVLCVVLVKSEVVILAHWFFSRVCVIFRSDFVKTGSERTHIHTKYESNQPHIHRRSDRCDVVRECLCVCVWQMQFTCCEFWFGYFVVGILVCRCECLCVLFVINIVSDIGSGSGGGTCLCVW